MLPGSPATLGYIIAPDNNGRTDPEIEPYPSWEMNQIGNCSALQFVQGIAIDANGVLWAVDSGRVNTLLPGKTEMLVNWHLIVLIDRISSHNSQQPTRLPTKAHALRSKA